MPRRKSLEPVRGRKAVGIEKCPTGIRGLDEITLGGLPRGRPTLIAGGAGSGKTLLATEFIAHGILDYDEPGVFMAFEETTQDLIKNIASLGFDLQDMIHRKMLDIDFVHIDRSEIEETGEYDLEGLFVRLGSMIDEIGAKRVVLDTIEALFAGLPNEAILRAELRRLFRWLKTKGVAAIITGERNRLLSVLKSRGMAHSNQVREFVLTNNGIQLKEVDVGPGEVLTGSARIAREARDKAQTVAENEAAVRRRRELEQERSLAKAQLEALQIKTAALDDGLKTLGRDEEARAAAAARDRAEMARTRNADRRQ